MFGKPNFRPLDGRPFYCYAKSINIEGATNARDTDPII